VTKPLSLNISEKFIKETRKELISIISFEWIEESEFSNNIIRLDTPSITIKCQFNRGPFDTLYNPAVGVNIMSALFMQDYVKDMPLSPTTKRLKNLFGHVIPSFGILYALPIIINGIQVRLSFYVFDVREFDVLIGQPIGKLVFGGETGKLDVSLGKF
jgi:hypothetical protein